MGSDDRGRPITVERGGMLPPVAWMYEEVAEGAPEVDEELALPFPATATTRACAVAELAADRTVEIPLAALCGLAVHELAARPPLMLPPPDARGVAPTRDEAGDSFREVDVALAPARALEVTETSGGTCPAVPVLLTRQPAVAFEVVKVAFAALAATRAAAPVDDPAGAPFRPEAVARPPARAAPGAFAPFAPDDTTRAPEVAEDVLDAAFAVLLTARAPARLPLDSAIPLTPAPVILVAAEAFDGADRPLTVAAAARAPAVALEVPAAVRPAVVRARAPALIEELADAAFAPADVARAPA